MNLTNLLLPSALLLSVSTKAADPNKPNIIYILADDLGYGDLSCYGQTRFSTPNIDNLAKNGIKFTQHYAGCTVSAPSRCSLMTGKHTGHSFIRGNKEMGEEGQYPLESKALTIAEALKSTGYTTGAFGKWGLGSPGSEGDPNRQGFDEFFGYNCQRLAHSYYPYHLWHNQEKIMLDGNRNAGTSEYGPEIIHQQALKFLEANKNKPFFLFYPSIIPHAELFAPERYIKRYRGKLNPESVFNGADTGKKFRNGGYGSQKEAHAAFAAMISLLDDQVGEIVAKLKELGIYENTLIIFTSDNGPHKEGGADPDYFKSNGNFRGYKRDVYEGGIREPMIASWEGKIKPGQITDHISAFWDVFPTLCELTGAKAPSNLDGISFLPVLLGKKQPQHDYLYWEFHELGGRTAVRQGDWKLVKYDVLKPEKTTTELYDLSTDPGEKTDLASKYPKLVKELNDIMNTARTESEIFKFSSQTIIK